MTYFLQDKIARFLYEYHDSDDSWLDLSPLELDRSDTNVHGVLKTYQADKLFKYIEYVQYTKCVEYVQNVNFAYSAYSTTFCIFHIFCILILVAYSAYSAYYTCIPYLTYSVYSAYFAYYDLIVYRMGGCLPVNHRLRAQWITSSLVCCSSVLHTASGAASSCPGGWYWNDPLPDARGISWLSGRKLW